MTLSGYTDGATAASARPLAPPRRQEYPICSRGESTLIEAPRNTLRWWRRKILSWSLLRNAAGCLYVGQNNKAFFRSLGVPERKLWPAHYSIDVDTFDTVSKSGPTRQSVRQRHGALSEDLVVVTVAKLIKRKRIADILLSLAETDTALRLWVIGDGEDRDVLTQLSKATLDNRVLWLGFQNQSEIPSLLAAADLFVLASGEETWGLVVNEAMACGLPCVVSNRVGCAADLIREGETGFIYPCGQTKALTQKLNDCYRSQSQLPAMGEKARQLAKDHYSVQRTASQIASAFLSCTE